MRKLSEENSEIYKSLCEGRTGFREFKRGLISVSGGESVKFLNGLITNDAAKLVDGSQMSAAFANAQGRILAVVRVAREGSRFLIDTEEVTARKVYDNLFRFTYAGDFFVEDLAEGFRYFEIVNHPGRFGNSFIEFEGRAARGIFIPNDACEQFLSDLRASGGIEIPEDVYEVIRVEAGAPLYGMDIDESTVVPEIGEEEVISYKKGCYIGQEVIARIYFRGHVAKELRVLEFECEQVEAGAELVSADGKSAGKVTSSVVSPRTGGAVALALVRYEFMAESTELFVDGARAFVKNPPLRGA